MKKTVEVIPATNTSLGKLQSFLYTIPENLIGRIKPCQEVVLNFHGRKIVGIVKNIVDDTSQFSIKMKNIDDIVDDKPTINPDQFKLIQWMSDYYHCSQGLILRMFLPSRLKRIKELKILNIKKTPFHKLNNKQLLAFNKISKTDGKPWLIHGVTGSGKTEIYLRLIENCLKDKRQAIVLVPEISLTPQAIQRYEEKFPRQVAILHSRLTPSEAFSSWTAIRNQSKNIVIGPRSALFAPVNKLGLIIIDEEHDSSYKQYDQAPRYNARDVAVNYAKTTGAKLVMGSATPSIESFYNAKRGTYGLATLPNRIHQKESLPPVNIIDMREEFKKDNYSIFSEALSRKLKETQDNSRQSILFINRRGAATFVMCRDCGYVLKCPNCDIPYTYHTTTHNLICHHCDKTENPPSVCPSCKSQYIKYFGTGTQKVEHAIGQLLPKANILRLDRDTAVKKNEVNRVYQDFSTHKSDILIGTQMVAKGLDIPKVDLIGIISADPTLNLPDFRSAEKTFQLITQVAGRTGRLDNPGYVILQTYNPDNKVIKLASHHDYIGFYEWEIKERKKHLYPPFSKLIKLFIENPDQRKAEEISQDLFNKITKFIKVNALQVVIIGPAPSFRYKVRNKYRYQIILKIIKYSDKINELLAIINPPWKEDIDPENLL